MFTDNYVEEKSPEISVQIMGILSQGKKHLPVLTNTRSIYNSMNSYNVLIIL